MPYTNADPLPVNVVLGGSAGPASGDLTDAPATSGTGGSWSIPALLRGILNTLLAPLDFLAPTPLLTANDLSRFKVAITDNTNTAIVALTASQTVRIHRIRLYAKTTAVDVSIYDGVPGSGGTELESIPLAAGGGIILDFDSRPYWESTSGATLYLKASGACDLRGQVAYKKSA